MFSKKLFIYIIALFRDINLFWRLLIRRNISVMVICTVIIFFPYFHKYTMFYEYTSVYLYDHVRTQIFIKLLLKSVLTSYTRYRCFRRREGIIIAIWYILHVQKNKYRNKDFSLIDNSFKRNIYENSKCITRTIRLEFNEATSFLVDKSRATIFRYNSKQSVCIPERRHVASRITRFSPRDRLVS